MHRRRPAILLLRLGLALRVLGWFVVVEILLRSTTLTTTCRVLRVAVAERASGLPPRRVSDPVGARRVRMAERINNRWPAGGTCLRRSLVLACVLRDLSPLLLIGVRRVGDQRFGAHAWLEIDGRSIDPYSVDYIVMPMR